MKKEHFLVDVLIVTKCTV